MNIRTNASDRAAINRRNAAKSTGPRSTDGKRRSSQNALKHGLRAESPLPPCEDLPAFSVFRSHLEQELAPATFTQRELFDQIISVMWRLRRLPEAQAHLFIPELDKAADNENLSPAEVMARRFSDDASNGFILLGRYERTLQNALLRMLRQYDQLSERSQTKPEQNRSGGSETAISPVSNEALLAERSQLPTPEVLP
jgi:hypothetical protein